jgi:hypothetical protein
MGYYHEQRSAGPEPSGCRDALVLTRAVFGILFWPLLLLFGALAGLLLIFYCFASHVWLGILALMVVGAGFFGLARWAKRHFQGHSAL